MKKNWINGAWTEASAGMNNVNPADVSDIIDVYAEGSPDDVNAAVAAAREAGPEWAATTPQQRFDILDNVGSEILSRKEELGRLLAREEGKTLPEAMGEVGRAAQIFKFFAGEALRNSGDKLGSVRPGVQVDMDREPMGVIGLITPWNFPIAIPAWKIAPALAYGNTVVLKPAEPAPGSAWALTEILSRSGLPKGAYNMVMGRGDVVGAALVNHPDVAGISFTGSVGVGRGVAVQCAQNMKKVQLEMGGKNPLVVLDDADLDVAVKIAVNGAYFSTGQKCTASSRLIVTEGIHDAFVEAVVKKLAALKVGDPLEPGVHLGPAIDGRQLSKNLEYMEIGRNEGAELAYGGDRLNLEKEGYFMAPALFVNTHNQMRINREEIFGPIATVIKVKDYDEALAVANDTEFGLSAGICTTSLKYASHFQRHSQAGMVMVNLPTAGVDYHVPFGGRKGSSYGSREQGSYAAEFYTTVKTTYIASGA